MKICWFNIFLFNLQIVKYFQIDHPKKFSNLYSINSLLSLSLSLLQRLTKEALAKHTREQDEHYVLDILRQSNQASAPKRVSEHPQNICAQAPNVFSRNEYEPVSANKKRKVISAAVQTQQVDVNTGEKTNHPNNINTSSSNNNTNVELLRQSNKNITVVRSSENDENDESSGGENEMLKRLGATYSNEINEIDFDNPQLYHEIFTKSSNVKTTLDKLMAAHGSMSEEKPVSNARLKGEIYYLTYIFNQ